jgi:hypothetical protein
MFFILKMGNCYSSNTTSEEREGGFETSTTTHFELAEMDQTNNNNYEAPLATEESLEDADPLPAHYQVIRNTQNYLVIRNRLNGSQLIYNKFTNDYQVVQEQCQHTFRNSNEWPNVLTYVNVGSGDRHVGRLQVGPQRRSVVVTTAVIAVVKTVGVVGQAHDQKANHKHRKETPV